MDARAALESRMDGGVEAMAAASAELLSAIVPYDRGGLWMRDGATSMTAWLAARYHEPRSTTREWVRVAWALEELPRIFRAYAGGRLSWGQVRFLTRFAKPEEDQAWAERARGLSPADLLYEAEQRERVNTRRAHDAHRRRGVTTWWEENELHLHGRFGPDQGARVERALERAAERMPRDEDAERPGEARAADALAEAVTGGGAGGRAPVALVVHADARTVWGTAKAGEPVVAETETGRRLAPETLRRLGCDATVELVLEQDGRPVGIGRGGRVPPPWLRRLVVHRDRGMCRFPGCERKRWVEAHHIRHWTDEGPTDLDNLVLLCDSHHRLMHEGGWTIRGHPSWVLRFHDPDGRAVRPPDLQPVLPAAVGFG